MKLFASMKAWHVGLGESHFSAKLDERLELPRAKVAEMKRNLHSPSQRREAYLDLYATGHPCPSWSQVAEVLRDVFLPYQADTVESTYVQGRERYITVLLLSL